MKQKGIDARVAKELNRLCLQFRMAIHADINDQLDQEDEVTGLPMIQTLIAYAGQGCEIKIALQIIVPDEQTEIEQKAAQSGIEIVKA